LLNRYKDSETDLTSALVFEPNNPDALRYRADARHKQGKLDLAQADIDLAMRLSPASVETALIRGQIKEAIRMRKKEQIDKLDNSDNPPRSGGTSWTVPEEQIKDKSTAPKRSTGTIREDK